MALRHSCPNAGASGSARCVVNRPGKGPKRCPGCKGTLEVEEGWYGVFYFDPTGRRYTAADAIRRFEIEGPAGRAADKLTEAERVRSCTFDSPGGYVVRFVRERLL